MIKKTFDYLLSLCTLPVLGMVLTVNYFLLIYWLFHDRFFQLEDIPLNEIGDFLAGVFGPIAFLWLVIGYLMQNRELRNQLIEYKENLNLTKRSLNITEKNKAYIENRERNYRQPLFKIKVNKILNGIDFNHGDNNRYFIDIYNFGETVMNVQIFDPEILKNFKRESVFEANSTLSVEIPLNKNYVKFDEKLLKEKESIMLNIKIAFLDKSGENGTANVMITPDFDNNEPLIKVSHTIRELKDDH
jgi:hypothetical protein